MIEFKGIYKSFGKKSVLEDVNLELESGKIYGFVGRNASGKTVLFKMLCGFFAPTKGEVLVDGKKIGKEIDFPEDCGIIIETPGFIDYLTGKKNLQILASIRNIIGNEEIEESMIRVGLEPNAKEQVKKYSLGMKQKLAIAQAIMEKPKILILDEPMNSLDEISVKMIREILLELKKEGVTILISSHIREDIDVLSDEVFAIKEGKVSLEVINVDK
ncbi:MAG: ATP-binding cassette domain-containing protein [Clostridium sp.]